MDLNEMQKLARETEHLQDRLVRVICAITNLKNDKSTIELNFGDYYFKLHNDYPDVSEPAKTEIINALIVYKTSIEQRLEAIAKMF